MIESLPASARGGFLLRGLLIVAVLGVIGAAAWVVLLPGIAVSTIQARTGFVVKVDQMSINPFTGKASIQGAVVENPIGWPTPEFITLRHFKLEADLLPLLEHRFVADEMVVDIECLSLVRNKDGLLNTEAFRQGLSRPATAADQAGREKVKTGFLIRHLVLKFDRLVMADYSGGKPSVKEYDLKLEREMREVDSVTKLVSPFASVVLSTSGKLFEAAPGPVGQAVTALQQAGKKTGGTLKKLFQSLEKQKP